MSRKRTNNSAMTEGNRQVITRQANAALISAMPERIFAEAQ